jgi:hypothetical protein
MNALQPELRTDPYREVSLRAGRACVVPQLNQGAPLDLDCHDRSDHKMDEHKPNRKSNDPLDFK